MGELTVGDFAVYFHAVHGVDPFPWQARLLEEVVDRGRWPDLLDLPTGTGKTAAIDVALFHLAIDASRPVGDRRAPRRVLMIVDRRTVVDQAFERARRIASALDDAKHPVLAQVATALRALANLPDDEAPFALAQLRGGMPRDDAWARRPDQVVVAASTVDQVGSRLLFRGYGVSPGMRPIHAGLLGNDALLLLDEVHLSEPFRQTLSAIAKYRRDPEVRELLPDRWQFVQMSATHAAEEGMRFQLDERDRADAVLARRLGASKPVTTEEIKVAGQASARRSMFARACAGRALSLQGKGRAVAVIVNRVATAREVFDAVQAAKTGARVFLVTGRMRPLERDDVNAELKELVGADRRRDPEAPGVVVVATQCIEAGADYDFDAVVSECASLDALRQRFGRLNRLGASIEAIGVVLGRSDLDEEDPIYGAALVKTWAWLGSGRDFGIEAMSTALAEQGDVGELLPPRKRAPVMLPSHLDAWNQTNPGPRPDPEVAFWLHGVEAPVEPEVRIVWRADVTVAHLSAAEAGAPVAADTDDPLEMLEDLVEACPPTTLEALSVPLSAARAWLLETPAPELSDVELAPVEEEANRDDDAGRPAFAWRGSDPSRSSRRRSIVRGRDLAPEMTLVVPSAYGGIEDRAWSPRAKQAVVDLGDQARFSQTRRPTLRLDERVHAEFAGAPRPEAEQEDDPWDALGAWLSDLAPAGALGEIVDALKRGKPTVLTLEGLNGEVGVRRFALLGRQLANTSHRARRGEGAGSDVTTEADLGSFTGVRVPLLDHLNGVGVWAADLGARCGLSEQLVSDLRLAGAWHDAGKVDERFQRLLRDGEASGVLSTRDALAKSALPTAGSARRRRAQALSGYPRGARHELASLALLESVRPWLERHAHDVDLVLHLVASHHGWCRPFAPVAEDASPVDLVFEREDIVARASSAHGLERLDAGVADRFFRLVDRYGWFGLAWLEALLRLGDHRRSEEEQQGSRA